ncbi:F-type H+-transporting ATPase subunit delta [Natronocella acetinitrilica]|jgi:F-type H+-transporting ATPase subunit delta|uniref:ATP synthase subunit delta n=1 Tax=Natronocella acetinitrilica TaxID=414046 RepID=A0AAE3KAD2_9GAMM|nr:F0F1 ATP synthase subunit delta [Natronocella acetinitrilica]MCP1673384.1 F-type H+-transporting ATPase subunit delta [Natronocella acetinitrilica]
MAELTTIARPYAQAVFKHAKEHKQLGPWSETLQLLGLIAADERMQPVLSSPRPSADELVGLFSDLCGDRLSEAGRNLIRLLAENRRLMALPALVKQFEELRAAEEGTLQALLTSALPVEDKVRDELAKALGNRLQRKVSLETAVDERLLGGAIIRAGDLVIDGSVRGRLQRMATQLSR